MSFYEKFELLAPLRDDGVKTFAARSIATGHNVEAHLFVAGNVPDTISLTQRLRSLPPHAAQYLVDLGEFQGTAYAVTLPLPNGLPLRLWLNSLAAPAAPAPNYQAALERGETLPSFRVPELNQPQAQAAKTLAQQLERGETLPAFKIPNLPTAPGGPATAKPNELPTMPMPVSNAAGFPPAATQPSAQPAGAGDFTRMFQAGGFPGGSSAAPTVPSAPPPSTLPTAPAPVVPAQVAPLPAPAPTVVPTPVAPPAQAAPPASTPVGEFTRMFQAGAPALGDALGQSLDAAAAKLPDDVSKAASAAKVDLDATVEMTKTAAPKAAEAVDEFALLFGDASAPTSAPPAPVAPVAIKHEPSALPAQTAAPVAPTQALGEFTRMFSAPSPTAAPVVPTPAAAPLPQPAAPAPAAPALPPQAPVAGTFTQMFSAPATPPVAPHVASPLPTAPLPSAPQPVAQPPISQPTIPQTLPSPSTPAAGAGEFTRMFSAPPSAVPAAPATPAPGNKTIARDEEFMKLFQVPNREKPGQAAPPAMPAAATPPPPSSPAGVGPGEVTRLFQSAAPAPQAAPQGQFPQQPQFPPPAQFPTTPANAGPTVLPTSGSSSAPGELTRLFSAPSLSQAPVNPAAGGLPNAGMVNPSAQPGLPNAGLPNAGLPNPNFGGAPGGFTPKPLDAPGAFTQMFGAVGGTGAPAAMFPGQGTNKPAGNPSVGMPGNTNPASSATMVFNTPQAGGMGGGAGQAPPAAPSGPGEYTRMFSAPGQGAPGAGAAGAGAPGGGAGGAGFGQQAGQMANFSMSAPVANAPQVSMPQANWTPGQGAPNFSQGNVSMPNLSGPSMSMGGGSLPTQLPSGMPGGMPGAGGQPPIPAAGGNQMVLIALGAIFLLVLAVVVIFAIRK